MVVVAGLRATTNGHWVLANATALTRAHTHDVGVHGTRNAVLHFDVQFRQTVVFDSRRLRSRTSRTRRSARPSGREITGTTMETRSGRWVFPETLLAFMSLPSRSFLAYPGIGKYGTENTFDTQLRAMNIQ